MNTPASRPEFTARYFVESSVASEKIAQVIAGEQSSGTFLSLPGETIELKERSRARVVSINPLAPTLQSTLPSAYVDRHPHGGVFHRAEIEIAFPVANVGANLPTLLATIAGNLYELGEVTGLRLLDLDMSSEYAAQFAGPAFGIAGTRRLAGVHGRPIIGTIIKPSIGLSPEQTAELVDRLCAADIDFIKDDELLADPPYAPFDHRLRAVMPVLKRHADRLGRMPMYAINISGTIDEMLRRHDAVLAAGGTCVMVSANWVGFSGVEHLRRHSQLRARSRAPRLPRVDAPPRPGLLLPGVPEVVASGRRRPAPCQRHPEQVLRGRRVGDRVSPRLPGGVGGRASPHARVLVWPVGGTGA